MKKVIRTSLSILLIMTILMMSVACSSTEVVKETEEPVVLTLWHYYNGTTKEMMDSLVQNFNETEGKENNILIDAYSYSSVGELATSLLDSANNEVGASPMPDIFASYSDNAFSLDKMSIVASLDNYFTDEEINSYRAEFIEEGRFDEEGNLKIVPVAKSTELLYINETDLNEFINATGADKNKLNTWEGVSEISKLYYEWTDSLTDEQNDGEAFFGIDSFANLFISGMKQLGEEPYLYEGEDITFNLSEENAKKFWDYIYKPYINGHYASVGRFRSDDIRSKDLIAYVGSTASTFYFPTKVELGKDESYDINCLTLPYPVFDGGENYAIQQGAGMVVLKSDEQRENAAVRFLKWFTEPENNIEFATATGYMPVKNDALSYDKIIEHVDMQGADIASSLLSSTDVVYNTALKEYQLFATKPFANSYDVRSILDNTLKDEIAVNLEKLNEAVTNGEDKNTVIEEITSDANFKIWYDNLVKKIAETIG